MAAHERDKVKHIFIISDATGVTAERVIQATLAQFHGTDVRVTLVPDVRSAAQLQEVIAAAARVGGLVAYTLVENELRNEVAARANEASVPTVDILGPLMHALGDFLAAAPSRRAGLRFDKAGTEHYRRLEAVSFTVKHDDGLGLGEIDRADIVIVGPSRTSKTPLSAYLAHERGVRVANVPLALGLTPPPELKALPAHRVVGLTMNARVLSLLRETRARESGAPDIEYAQLDHVQRELRFCHELYRTPPVWPVIDVTSKSIEEVATAVCAETIDRRAADGA